MNGGLLLVFCGLFVVCYTLMLCNTLTDHPKLFSKKLQRTLFSEQTTSPTITMTPSAPNKQRPRLITSSVASFAFFAPTHRLPCLFLVVFSTLALLPGFTLLRFLATLHDFVRPVSSYVSNGFHSTVALFRRGFKTTKYILATTPLLVVQASKDGTPTLQASGASAPAGLRGWTAQEIAATLGPCRGGVRPFVRGKFSVYPVDGG
jgi:hypothetical protein